ncbi:MAG TPA: GNAT family N-acetyltransferase [Rhizomicrobium sp.]|jgi:RimJ/RimL family protein N-acetyltransferase|nr:GNAT family N-acetyltransferase [Rhizomicrobium sp.]
MMHEVPTLETERLILRDYRKNDFPAYAAMWAMPEVVRHINGTPLAEDEAWAKFLRIAGQWPVLGYSFFAVEEKSSGRFVGETGFIEGMRDIEPLLKGIPEMGWSLSPTVQGKGYALEAATAARDWGLTHFGKRAFRCIISPENGPSIRLAQKLGFAELTRTTFKGKPTIMFERPA